MPISVTTGIGSSTSSLKSGNLVGSIHTKPIINAIAAQNSRKAQKAVKQRTNKKIKGKKKIAKQLAEQNRLTKTDSKSIVSSVVSNDDNKHADQNDSFSTKHRSGLSLDLKDFSFDGSITLADSFENINVPLEKDKKSKTPNWIVIDEDQVDDWSLIDEEEFNF